MKQGIYEASVDKIYPLGKRVAVDERVFRYCKAGGPIVMPFWACGNANKVSINRVAFPVEIAAGLRDVTITDGAAALNDYENGWLFVESTVSAINDLYRIRGNEATSAGRVVLHLHDPITHLIPVTAFAHVWKNKYSNVIKIGENPAGVAIPGGWRTAVCVPLITVPLGSYFWGQTWGPCWGWYSVAELGVAQNRRWVFFSYHDGAMVSHDEIVAGFAVADGCQPAGVLIPETEAGAGNGSGFYRLMLEP